MRDDRTRVDLDVVRQIGVITLAGPRVRNALAMSSIDSFASILDAVRSSATVRVVVITGAGGAFCAGGDLREESEGAASGDPGGAFVGFATRWNEGVLDRLEHLPQPTIAAIDGAAVGGGFELAISCDIRVAGASARLGDREVRLGLVGGMARLLRIVSMSTALWLALPSRLVNADEALRLGLVHDVATDGPALSRALQIAEEIAVHPPVAVTATKRLIREAYGVTAEKAMAMELEALGRLGAGTEVSGLLAEAKASGGQQALPREAVP
jgi:enoyl-CoA hydratase/carnithine racemase